MSVYVVTKSNACIEYSAPPGKSVWLSRNNEGERHLIYWCNCKCCSDQIKHTKAPHTRDHEVWIGWVNDEEIVSIGFEKPNVFFGMPAADFRKLQKLEEWLYKKRMHTYLPLRVIPLLEALQRYLSSIKSS